jgi:hypothetical protein
MRSLTFAQLLLLVLFVGIPLVRALARWIREQSQPPGATGSLPETPERPASADPEQELSWRPQLPIAMAVLQPEIVPTAPAVSATRAADDQMGAPRPAVVQLSPPPVRPALAKARSLLREGEGGMRTAFVLKTILDPPRALEPMEPNR